MNTPVNITELVCTRVSHDLIGNIGALGNAVELLEDGDNDFLPEIKSMLKISFGVLSARLKFFRMAFGRTNANLENPKIVSQTCADYIKTLNPHHPIELDITPVDGQSGLNRALMLAVMTAADVIIKGGKITLSADSRRITARAESPFPLAQTKIQDMQTILNNKLPDNLPQYAPLFALREMGAAMTIGTDSAFTLFIE